MTFSKWLILQVPATVYIFCTQICTSVSPRQAIERISPSFVFSVVHACVCVPACNESQGAGGKGMPALWQMVGKNLAASTSLSMSTPPTRLPALPRVYFPPRTQSAHLFAERKIASHLRFLPEAGSFTSGSL